MFLRCTLYAAIDCRSPKRSGRLQCFEGAAVRRYGPLHIERAFPVPESKEYPEYPWCAGTDRCTSDGVALLTHLTVPDT